MLWCGIDEAGRGPVIGPMVLAGVVIDKDDNEKLRLLGARDSKTLTKEIREQLFGKIVDVAIRHSLVVVQPSEIDKAVQSKTYNLNWLEADKAAEIINELAPGKAWMDCPSPNIVAYSDYIKERLKWPDQVGLVCAHHADRDHPVVAAASILAKVTRDEHIQKLKDKLGVDFGSGYAHDEVTVEFLKNNWKKYPEIFRQSWASYKRHAGAGRGAGQKNLGNF